MTSARFLVDAPLASAWQADDELIMRAPGLEASAVPLPGDLPDVGATSLDDVPFLWGTQPRVQRSSRNSRNASASSFFDAKLRYSVIFATSASAVIVSTPIARTPLRLKRS